MGDSRVIWANLRSDRIHSKVACVKNRVMKTNESFTAPELRSFCVGVNSWKSKLNWSDKAYVYFSSLVLKQHLPNLQHSVKTLTSQPVSLLSVWDILNHKWLVASFLLRRKARQEWDKPVYTQRLTANYLAWPSRCVWLAHTQPLCLKTQYWRSPCRRVTSRVKTYTIYQTGQNYYLHIFVIMSSVLTCLVTLLCLQAVCICSLHEGVYLCTVHRANLSLLYPGTVRRPSVIPFRSLPELSASHHPLFDYAAQPGTMGFLLCPLCRREPIGWESQLERVCWSVFTVRVHVPSWLCVGRLVVRGRAPTVPSGSADASTSAAGVGEQQPDWSEQWLGGWRQQYWYPVISHAGQMQLNMTPLTNSLFWIESWDKL